MSLTTFIVHLELGRSNAGLLNVAGGLAERIRTQVTGIAVCQPMQVLYNDGCYVSGDLIEQDRKDIAHEIDEAEAEFRTALGRRAASLDWRSVVTMAPLAECIAQEARCADLVITGVTRGKAVDVSRRVSAGDLVMQAGRPVLVVPRGVDGLKLDRVLIGWKETREARRAAINALPLIKEAGHVVVVEIAAEEEMVEARTHLQDVARWLRRHGVTADIVASPLTGGTEDGLGAIADEHCADLIVAGAYGHSRLREWALGGMTRDLLQRADRCSLLSH